MNSEAPIGEKRRGFCRWQRLVYSLLGLPRGTLLLGNLVLSNPWAYRRIASRIKHHTGTEIRIGGSSRSPWNYFDPPRCALLTRNFSSLPPQ